jgi:hypothetical protein
MARGPGNVGALSTGNLVLQHPLHFPPYEATARCNGVRPRPVFGANAERRYGPRGAASSRGAGTSRKLSAGSVLSHFLSRNA